MLDRARLAGLCRGPVFFDEPLSRHTSFGIGGAAEALVVPRDEEDLSGILRHCSENRIPCYVTGRGTNLLVADEALPGVVVKIAGTLKNVSLDGSFLEAGGGASLIGVARYTASRGLAGLEWAAGIPGTVGGAVALNAGAAGGDMAKMVRKVRVLRPGEAMEELSPERIEFGYRETSLSTEPGAVTGVILELSAGDARELERTMRAHLARRRLTQPRGLRSAGCVFRNPPGSYAGLLLEEVGAKEWREGGAEFSRVHANFAVNRGGARARDVLHLMRRGWETVRDARGIELRPEVHFLGFPREEDLLPGSVVLTDFSRPR